MFNEGGSKIKIQKLFYACVLSAAMVLSVCTITVFANNHTDKGFTFSFPLGTNIDYTDARPKEDSSSVYMKLQKLQGATNPSFTASVVDFNNRNFSKTWYYTFNSSNINQGRYMLNQAYEDKGKNVPVRVKAVRGADKNGFAGSGVWSPDSI